MAVKNTQFPANLCNRSGFLPYFQGIEYILGKVFRSIYRFRKRFSVNHIG